MTDRRSEPARAAPGHEGEDPAAPSAAERPVIALVGSPNVGKSSLFNTLTGASRTVGNWAGTSVEVGSGPWSLPHGRVTLIDLPGAYSLDPLSPDEQLTRDLLVDGSESVRPEVVVVVVSAVDLARTLSLAYQIREHRLRVVIALTMGDVATRRGLVVDVAALAADLEVRVVPVDARRGRADGLATEVERLRHAPIPEPLTIISDDDSDPFRRADERFTRIARVVSRVTAASSRRQVRWSDRIDRYATSSVTGPLLFLAVMWVIFQLTTQVATPIQRLLDAAVSGPISGAATAGMRAVGLADTWLNGLVVDGIIAGAGMLLTFVPLMALMFALLSVLEDSGYLARAAVVTDRLMRALGLPGKAFLPLVVGFGCNVPAVSATRVLGDARQRLLTVLLVPYTSCSARLTVYVLVASTFFGEHAGTVVFAMYVLSIVMVVIGGVLLRGTLIRALGPEDLVLDLPRYQWPEPRLLMAVTWTRLAAFLRTAGGVIVAVVVVVWALSAIPVGAQPVASGPLPVEQSAYGRLATTVAPVFEPAGFGEWHAAGALLVGFVAKEAVVSSWAQTYAAAEPDDLRRPGALGESLQADFARSSDGHVVPAVLAFLVFLLGYTPCAATVAAQRREIGWAWTATGMALQLVLAWTLAVLVFQLGRLVA